MKITKQRLQEIILEEMKEAEIVREAGRGSAMAPLAGGDRPGEMPPEKPETEKEKFTRQTGIAGEREGGSAQERAREAAALTTREGALLSIIQALRTEIGAPGEVEDVSGVTRDLMRGLGKARKQ